MALLVWFPLNGNIENKGLSNVSSYSGSTPVYSAGKIGQCLEGSSGEIAFHFDDANLIENICLNKKYTIMTWLKNNAASSGVSRWVFRIGNGTGTSRGLWENNSGTTRHWAFSGTGVNCSTSIDCTQGWHHTCFVVDGTIVTLYVDGVKQGSATDSTTLPTENTITFNSYRDSLNDFRLYNEVLSDKQIKEIAKGLCAHYKLEGVGANPNLLVDAGNRSKWTYESCTRVNDTDSKVIGFSVSSANQRIYLEVTNVWKSGQKYTYSFDAKASVNNARLDVSRSIANFGPNHYLTTEWQHYSGEISSTVTVDGGTLSIRGNTANTTYYLKNIKLENGEEETNYIPNINDIEYTELGYDKALTTDVSGFGYNGTITGELTFDSDSPRYAGSTKFNGSSYITTTPGSLAWCNFDNLTISAWMKPTVKPGGWTGSIGIQQDGGTNGKVFSISNYAGNFSVHTDNGSGWVTTQSEALPLNQWSHCVATLTNGTNLKMYINGELVKTATINYNTATVLSDTRIAIGVDLPGDDEKYTGSYSDARFYSTALSAEDILKLYEISGIIDNKGNTYSYEFIDTNNIIASDKYFAGHSNFYDTFTRSIIEDSESPSGEAMKLTCTANGTQASRGYYFGNVEPWTTAKTKMVHGHTYELSMFVKMNKEATNFRMNVECASSQSQTIFSIGTKYKRLVNTFVYDANTTYSAITNYGTIFNVGDEIFIHSPQIQEVDIQYKLNKNGILSHSGLDESSQAKIYKYSTEANNFIEI